MTQLVNGSQMGSWSGYPRYVYLSGDVTRSGNTVTLSNLRFYFTASNAYASGYSETIEIKNGGTTISSTGTVWTFSGGTSPTISLNNGSFTVSASATSATLTLTASGDSVNFSVSFPAGTTPPSGLSISNIIPAPDAFTATVSVAAWNGGTSATRRLELSVCTAQSAAQRKKAVIYGDALSSDLTVDNSSTFTDGNPFTITPNARYYLTMWASNGDAGTGNSQFTQAITLAEAPTVSLGSVTDTTATISYSVVADGGFYDKTIEYSIDGGTTWNAGATVSTGSASSGTFTITGLSAGTTYNVQTRVTTTAGSTTGTTLTVTTSAPVTNAALYGSVNDQSKKIIKLYGSVNSQTKLIKKLYGSVNGVTKLVYEA